MKYSTEQQARWRATKKQKCLEVVQEFKILFNSACCRCGFDNPAALQFHHKDPSIKRSRIAQLVTRTSPNIIRLELESCELLCANCHCIEHANVQ